jgi:hypothetical protein
VIRNRNGGRMKLLFRQDKVIGKIDILLLVGNSV